MEWRKYLRLMGLLLAIIILTGGFSPGHAQSSKKAVQSSASAQNESSMSQERKKSALQRRQEAKKRLLESIEERKARRLAGPDVLTPDKAGKGVQHE